MFHQKLVHWRSVAERVDLKEKEGEEDEEEEEAAAAAAAKKEVSGSTGRR